MIITESLSHWLCSHRWQDPPPNVQQYAVDVVFDSVGAMIACSQLPEVITLVKWLRRMGGDAQCTMIGQAGLTSVVNAAMANGGMAHGDESDLVHLKSVGGHVAAGPVPTALCVGQWLDASGVDL
jgi:2-methylcitrate dehydratase PrpD